MKNCSISFCNVASTLCFALLPTSTSAQDPQPPIPALRVLIGFQPKHADAGLLKWKPALARDVLGWQQFKQAEAVDLRATLPASRALEWREKEARRHELEQSLGQFLGGIKSSNETVPRYNPAVNPEDAGFTYWNLEGNRGTASIAASEGGRLRIRIQSEEPPQDVDDFYRNARTFVKEVWGTDPGEPIVVGSRNSRLRHLEWRNDGGNADVMASRLELYYGAGDRPQTTSLRLRCGTGPLEWSRLTADDLARRHNCPGEREALAIATLILEDIANRQAVLDQAAKLGVSVDIDKLKVRRVVFFAHSSSLCYWRVVAASDADWAAGRAIKLHISSADQVGRYTSPEYITRWGPALYSTDGPLEPSSVSIACTDIRSWSEYAQTVRFIEQRHNDRKAHIAQHTQLIIRHLQSLQGGMIEEVSIDPEFRIHEYGETQYLVAQFASGEAYYRLVEDKPELDFINIRWNERLQKRFGTPDQWRRFGEQTLVAVCGDQRQADFEYGDGGWIKWIPTWRGLPLPHRFQRLLSLNKADGQDAQWAHSSAVWKTEGALATELERAREGLGGYQLRGTPGDLIARAVKGAAATNEQLDLSRTKIVAAEYRLFDLHDLKASHGRQRNLADLPALETLEKRGPVAPLYCVKLTCLPPWPHNIELGLHPETGELICQIDNTRKF